MRINQGLAALGLILALIVPELSLAAGTCADGAVDLRLTGGGQGRFNIELADDAAGRSRGLMFRDTMAQSAGMLFIYEHPQHAVFWMKNTHIPLDMIFADASGVVKNVHANAIPYDETPIDGGEGIVAVLEINGGLANRLGITPGAVLRHPALSQTTAAWPCEQ